MPIEVSENQYFIDILLYHVHSLITFANYSNLLFNKILDVALPVHWGNVLSEEDIAQLRNFESITKDDLLILLIRKEDIFKKIISSAQNFQEVVTTYSNYRNELFQTLMVFSKKGPY